MCGPAPAQAVARGLTKQLFCDDFPNLSSIDTNDTLSPEFKWYVRNRWPGLAAGRTVWQIVPSTPANNFAIVAGGLQLTPSRNDQVSNMQTCATTGSAGGVVGYSFVGPIYIQIKIASVSAIGIQPGNNWWPAFWGIATEFLAAADPSPGAITFGEIDIFESINTFPTFTGRNIHWWTANGSGQADHTITYGGDIRELDGNTFGTLLIPASNNGGTGFVAGYLNDVHQTGVGDKAWPANDANYDHNATDHLCLMITSGMNQPLVIESVQVFGLQPQAGGLFSHQ